MKSGAFRICVAIALLLAVATVLIAPTVDLPDAVLHGPHAVSHASGKYAQGAVQTSFTEGTPYPADGAARLNLPARLDWGKHSHAEAFRVLRC